MGSKLILLRTLSKALKLQSPSSFSSKTQKSFLFPRCTTLLESSKFSLKSVRFSLSVYPCRGFYFRDYSTLNEGSQGPATIDYRSLLQEDEYHRLANSIIHHLLGKLEEYGDSVEIDGFDVDYGNEVLTLKLGSLGIYVINKQTPNRQIWMSSPVSGPSRFDWDQNSQAWIYRRTKKDLLKVLETELKQLCGECINFS